MNTRLSDFSETIIPTEVESNLASESCQRLAKIIERTPVQQLELSVKSDDVEEEAVSIPSSAFRVLRDVLAQMAEGHSVMLIPVHSELTSQQAADLLNVSRPFLIEQLNNGVIRHRKVGTHRRILLKDLMEYKAQMDQGRYKALEELSAIDQESDFGY